MKRQSPRTEDRRGIISIVIMQHQDYQHHRDLQEEMVSV